MDTNLPSGGDEHDPARADTQQFWNEPVPPQPPRYAPGPGAPGPGGPGQGVSGSGSGGPALGGPGYRGAGSGWAGQGGPGQWGAGPGGPGQGGPAYGQPQPGGPGFPPQPGPGSGEFRQHRPRDRRKAWQWTAGIAAAVLLAGGGAIAGVSLAGNSGPASLSAASSPAPASGGTAGPTGQAAVLNTALNSADSPSAPSYLDSSGSVASVSSASGAAGAAGAATVAGHARRCLRARAAARIAGRPRIARAIRAACRHPMLRRLALRGLHGEFTFRANGGSFKTIAFERGTIESVSSGSDIVVRASDGTTWTWELVPSTVVRENGSKTSESALAAGDQVWTGGPVAKGAKDARLIVIRPGTPAPSNG